MNQTPGGDELARLRDRAKPWPKGHYFEDFMPGSVLAHHWGRTLTESDNTLFSTMTMSYTPLYFNDEYAHAHGYDRTVLNPMLIFLTTFGLSVQDLSEIGGAFLGVSALTYHRPVLTGATLTARSTVVSRRDSRSRTREGIVTWHTEGLVDDDLVIDFERTNLIARKTPLEQP